VTPLSGRQIVLRHADYEASIASVGASLRRLRHLDRDLVVPFAEDELRPGYRGATLAPWPNRVVDGSYVYDGEEQQLALTEPDRGHALHGLAVWQDFAAIDVHEDRLTLQVDLPAQQGYPYQVRVTVDFALGAEGLVTTVTGTNVGARTAPWGTAPHPYLVAGPGLVDDWSLELPATQYLTVTEDRLIPLELAEVTAGDGAFDFRTPRPIGETFIDHAFTGLTRDDRGQAVVLVRDVSGAGVMLAFEAACPWVQVHTADRPNREENRIGLAVEPMTCAPDAFNSGLGLIHLAPGESHRASWRIAALDAP
jgi:aldose 1-epimerase